MRFQGKTALVTGSAQGIGLATARLLGHEGAAVMLCDLDQQALENARAALQAEGINAAALAVNVADEDAVDRLVAHTIQTHGGLDFLVNNAGITRDNLLFKMSVDDWDQVMNVHLRGAFLCTRAAQRHMVEQRSGRIVNLSSTSALGNRGQANYSSAKAGIQAFTRTAAIELGPYGITVNAVAPGFVDTEMTRQTAKRRGIEPEEYRQQRARNIPLGRVGTPEDIARVIAFFCSEDASFVSGQILYVRGGPETQR